MTYTLFSTDTSVFGVEIVLSSWYTIKIGLPTDHKKIFHSAVSRSTWDFKFQLGEKKRTRVSSLERHTSLHISFATRNRIHEHSDHSHNLTTNYIEHTLRSISVQSNAKSFLSVERKVIDNDDKEENIPRYFRNCFPLVWSNRLSKPLRGRNQTSRSNLDNFEHIYR